MGLFYVALFAVLRWIPRSFTIGEAMVVTEAVVLLSVDSFSDLGIKVNFIINFAVIKNLLEM